jgi:hypothetical protein
MHDPMDRPTGRQHEAQLARRLVGLGHVHAFELHRVPRRSQLERLPRPRHQAAELEAAIGSRLRARARELDRRLGERLPVETKDASPQHAALHPDDAQLLLALIADPDQTLGPQPPGTQLEEMRALRQAAQLAAPFGAKLAPGRRPGDEATSARQQPLPLTARQQQMAGTVAFEARLGLQQRQRAEFDLELQRLPVQPRLGPGQESLLALGLDQRARGQRRLPVPALLRRHRRSGVGREVHEQPRQQRERHDRAAPGGASSVGRGVSLHALGQRVSQERSGITRSLLSHGDVGVTKAKGIRRWSVGRSMLEFRDSCETEGSTRRPWSLGGWRRCEPRAAIPSQGLQP